MSLSRNQEENNYWPSISDMFLVFFVLALALLSTGRDAGDKFIQDDLIYEAGKLVEHANRDQQNIGWPDDPKNNMDDVALAMRQCRKWLAGKKDASNEAQKFIDEDEAEERDGTGITKQNSREVMGRNIKAMYLLVSAEPDQSLPDLYYDKMLREINLAITKDNGGMPPEEKAELLTKQLQDAKNEIARLKALLADKDKMIQVLQVEKGERGALITQVADLQRQIKEKDQEISRLREKISQLEADNSWLRKQIAVKDVTIQKQGAKIAHLENNSRISTVVLGEKDVTFDTGESEIKPKNFNRASFNKLLDEISRKLTTTECDWIIEVIGHTDPRGGDETNALLGLQRAQSIQKKIVEDFRGDKARLIFRTYSAASSDPRATYDASRRIEVIIRPSQQ